MPKTNLKYMSIIYTEPILVADFPNHPKKNFHYIESVDFLHNNSYRSAVLRPPARKRSYLQVLTTLMRVTEGAHKGARH